jgi:hypothetical protein
MKLENPITLLPSKYTDKSGQIVTPPAAVLNELEVIYIDNPKHQQYLIAIQGLPQQVMLFIGEEYSNNPDITKAQAQAKLYELSQGDLQSFLQNQFPRTLEDDPFGPGSILANMFSMLGIKSSPTCSCRKHALEMNVKGIEWCENNMETILGWLKDESEKRKIPFVKTLAQMVVTKAINKAKKYKEAENA